MRSFFKLGFGFGMMIMAMAAMPACGSDDDDGGGKSGGGGTGGGTGGSTGGGTGGGTDSGTGGSAGSAGSTGKCTPGPTDQAAACTDDPCACGTESCPSYGLGPGGIITVPPCCAGGDACGVSVDQGTAGLVSIAPGCYEVGQEGNPDPSCPAYDFISPLPPNDPASFEGCCRPDGQCGYAVDLTSAGGPDMGCVPADCSSGGTPTPCTPGAADSGTGGSAGAASDAAAD